MVKPGKSDLNGSEWLQRDKPREWASCNPRAFWVTWTQTILSWLSGKKLLFISGGHWMCLFSHPSGPTQLLSGRKTRVVTRCYNMMGLSFDFTSTALQHIQDSIFNNVIFLFLKQVKDFIQLTLVTRGGKQWQSMFLLVHLSPCNTHMLSLSNLFCIIDDKISVFVPGKILFNQWISFSGIFGFVNLSFFPLNFI